MLTVGVLAGCATPGMAPDQAGKVHRVAVLSVMTPRFTQQNVGITVFGNEHVVLDAGALGLDADYQRVLEDSLRRTTRYEVVHVDYMPDDYAAIYQFAGPWEAPAFMTPNFDRIADRLRETAAREKVDTIVVLAGRAMSDVYTQSNQTLFGLGIYTRTFGSRTGVSNVHLMGTLHAVSGATGKPTAAVPYLRPRTGGAFEWRASIPSVMLDSSVSRTRYAVMTDAQKQMLKEQAITLVSASAADDSLGRLFGGGKSP
jgi:hypothetical protein